jgi:RNA polymerase sigma factor (sigma-70 family)
LRDEKEIISACVKGNRSAFEALYNTYAGRLLAIAHRYAHTSFEAEDIVQETFIRVFQRIGQYENKGSFEGWLKRILVTTAINHFHSSKKEREKDDIQEMEIQDQNSEDVIDKISADELSAFIQQLPKGYRMVFNLYVVEGYTHKEIAEMLSVEEGTSKSQLSKARNMLKEMLLKHHYTLHG